jgi:hypothetical protein
MIGAGLFHNRIGSVTRKATPIDWKSPIADWASPYFVVALAVLDEGAAVGFENVDDRPIKPLGHSGGMKFGKSFLYCKAHNVGSLDIEAVAFDEIGKHLIDLLHDPVDRGASTTKPIRSSLVAT